MQRSLVVLAMGAAWALVGVGGVASCASDPIKSHIFDTDGDIPDGSGPDGVSPDGGPKDAGKDIDPGPGLCDPMAALGPATAVPGASTGGNDLFGAITADELTIAWMAKAGEVSYADRAALTDPFVTINTYKDSSVDLGRVALSGDGSTLVFTVSGHASLAQVTRAKRGDVFTGSPDQSPFVDLPPPPPEDAGPLGALFADPVLSDDGTLLYFTEYGLSQKATLTESYRTSKVPWPLGRELTNPELVVVGGKLRRPTGISADNRTLYFWDESTGIERAAFRKGVLPPLNTFAPFVDIGAAYQGAQPVKTCTRLYFNMPGEASSNLQIFFVDTK